VHGTSAITCITAQNPKGVYGIQACTAEIVRRQIEAVFDELRPAAVKTGMLYAAPIIRVVAESLRRYRGVPLVVDPVMVSTSGAQLLRPAAVKALCTQLLPLAAVVTPNLDEAEILVGERLSDVTDLRAAARELHRRFGCAALVKGGHLRGLREAVDIFYDGQQELLLSAPFVRGVSTHGTGCTYSAAIAGCLARGYGLPKAVEHAKQYITQAIAQSQNAGRHGVLHHYWR
jgi:hydroxymethylpyrimidine/phosphomethylpyrimidine kinase